MRRMVAAAGLMGLLFGAANGFLASDLLMHSTTIVLANPKPAGRGDLISCGTRAVSAEADNEGLVVLAQSVRSTTVLPSGKVRVVVLLKLTNGKRYRVNVVCHKTYDGEIHEVVQLH